jgi:isoleucyl-tRNA synthetase
VLRNFTLTLWNVYAFFVTYANLDQWTPGGKSVSTNDNLLDRWLISELNVLARQVTEALENYDVTGATRPIQAFVEDLSKWYLRRSRRRFWKSDTDDDKDSAYRTLYQALVTLSKLLAPSMPFLAEALHQNLVRTVVEGAPESVHQADWPGYDPEQIDEVLNDEMRLVMRLASLGHAARNQAGIKVRQPLGEAAFSVGRPDEAVALERHAELLADELNVKTVRLLRSADEAVSYSLKPLPRQLGQKYKGLFPRMAQAIQELDASQAAHLLLAGQPVEIQVDGQQYEIQPDEVEGRLDPQAGQAVAVDGAYIAALDTRLTPELVREGLARELVRRIQELRKQADLDVADRIHLYVTSTPELAGAIRAHRETILGETLAVELHASQAPEGAALAEAWFDGQWMKLGLVRVEK